MGRKPQQNHNKTTTNFPPPGLQNDEICTPAWFSGTITSAPEFPPSGCLGTVWGFRTRKYALDGQKRARGADFQGFAPGFERTAGCAASGAWVVRCANFADGQSIHNMKMARICSSTTSGSGMDSIPTACRIASHSGRSGGCFARNALRSVASCSGSSNRSLGASER